MVRKIYVIVKDEIETTSSEKVIRWNLVTSASVNITGNNIAVLTKNGKSLTIKVREPATVAMKTWSTVPSHTYDAKNPGTTMIGFEVTVPANTKASLTVLLLPEGAIENSMISKLNLEGWQK